MDKKSIESLNAAKELISKHFFTQSVHCSYYAVRQMMQFKLANMKCKPMSYEEQEEKFRGKDSHEELLNEIKYRIVKPKDSKNFTEDFRILKKERQRADYCRDTYDMDKGTECKSLAERLISKLNYFFHT